MARKPPRKKPTRTRLDPPLINALAEAVRLGLPYRHACAQTLTPVPTFFAWMNQGRKLIDRIENGERIIPNRAEKMWMALVRQVEEARAALFARNLAHVQIAARKEWQAGAWLCERLDPENFGRKFQPIDTGASDNSNVRSPAEIAEAMVARTLGLDAPPPALPPPAAAPESQQPPTIPANPPA